jgi:hypothetical protein
MGWIGSFDGHGGDAVIFAGVDCAEAHHDVCVMAGAVPEQDRRSAAPRRTAAQHRATCAGIQTALRAGYLHAAAAVPARSSVRRSCAPCFIVCLTPLVATDVR